MTDSGINGTLSKSAGNTKLSGAVGTPEGKIPSRETWKSSRSGPMTTPCCTEELLRQMIESTVPLKRY